MKSESYNFISLKKISTSNFGCLILIALISINLTQLFAGLTEGQEIIITSDAQLDLNDDTQLYAPINFTTSGLQCYLKHVYNHPKYAQDVLPNDFSHIIQFLEYGKNSNQTEEYTISVLRLFHQKFFSLEYVNAVQLSKLIEALPNLLTKHRTPKVEIMVTRLIENGINRIIWSPEDRDGAWRQFANMGHKLEDLNKCGAIEDAEDCNDLLTNLVARFSYVVGLIGSDLPVTFYDKAYQDIRTGQLTWLQYQETETLIASKFERLQHILLLGSSKAKAREQFGTITQPILV